MTMDYTRLGHSGLQVSRLCFGAMTFGDARGLPGITGVDQALAAEMVAAALDAGINFFDTADAYSNGVSEQMLGKLLASQRRDLVIATKVGFPTGSAKTRRGLSRRHILASCDTSLKNLGTDYIDLYIAHRDDPYTPLEETLDAFDSLVKAGKVRYLGFSNWSAWQSAKALQFQRDHNLATFINGQMYYSLVGREVEHEVLPFFVAEGVGMTVWSPLAGGYLSGKYTSARLAEDKGRLQTFDFPPIDRDLGARLIATMEALAPRLDMSLSQIAIAWLLAKTGVDSVLIGATKLHQLADNLKAGARPLPAEVVEELDQLSAIPAIYPNWYQKLF